MLYLKRNGNKRFTIVDAAMNDLIRPSLYQARHEITPVNLVKGRSERVQSDIAGPVCESGDFLARDAMLPAVAQGENFACSMPALTACHWLRTIIPVHARLKFWWMAPALA